MRGMKLPKKKGRPIVLIVVLLLVALAWWVGGRWLIKKIFPVDLSIQQQQLVKRFGFPTSYALIFGEATLENEYRPVRVEIWNYDRHGRAFYFIDGKFSQDSDIAFVNEAVAFPVVPTRFTVGLSLEQAQGVVGGKPTASGKVPEQIMPGTTIYDFSDQIKIGVKDNKVVYIQTFPLSGKN